MPKIPRGELAQMLMVGFSETHLPDFYYDWLRDGLGGIVLFSRNIENPEQLARLTDEIQKAARHVPALISADQEGGRVFRLKDPFTHFPTAQTVARSAFETGSTDLAREAARATARELAAMGIRLNFAPVLDVNTNPQNPIIGDRAYSDDAEKVAQLGQAVMDGLHLEGVIACGKHYPGHGDTTQDSHLDLPRVDTDGQLLLSREVLPYNRLIHGGLEMIMTAHVLYPTVDFKWPATLSEILIKEWLRERLGFNGIVITDDLEMKAIEGRYSWSEIVVQSVNAGVDILLICHKQEKQQAVFEALVEAVENRDIAVERAQEAIHRIKKLKKKFLKNPRPFFPFEWKEIIGCQAHRNLVAQLERFA